MLRLGRRGLVLRVGATLAQLSSRDGCIASRCLSLFSNGILIFSFCYIENQLIHSILIGFYLILIAAGYGLQSQQYSPTGLANGM